MVHCYFNKTQNNAKGFTGTQKQKIGSGVFYTFKRLNKSQHIGLVIAASSAEASTSWDLSIAPCLAFLRSRLTLKYSLFLAL